MLFGDRLRLLREDKSITQKELGLVIGVSDRVIGYYESNDRFPKDEDILRKIADYFNVSVDYLLGRTDDLSFNREEKIKEIEQMQDFQNAEDALKFILAQPSLMHYGGYDLKNMSHEEILEIANDMLFAMKLSLEKMKRKNK